MPAAVYTSHTPMINDMKVFVTTLLLIACLSATAIPNTDSTATDTSSLSSRQIGLETVVVSASSARLKDHVATAQMGKTDLPMAMLAKTVTIGGEPDIMKALQLTPGIKRGTEGSINMYVRGGGADENLILLDGVPLYNAGHLLGFFSLFNTAVVRDVEMYKSSFPARYGGRLSSVMDVRTKDGSLYDYKASANISNIASSATVQGPIIKDKVSFILSGRRTYIDKVMKQVPYYFYDVNAKASWVINSNNRLHLSMFTGSDVLDMKKQDGKEKTTELKTAMNMGNNVVSLRWNKIGSNNQYASDLQVYHSGFRYQVNGSMGENQLAMRSAITDMGVKGDVRLYNITGHKLSMGFNIINHTFNPNIIQTQGTQLERFGNSTGKLTKNNEAAVYVNDEYAINSRVLINSGLRLSTNITGSKTYFNPEPRIGFRYLLDGNSSVKISYARMVQYMHQVTGSSVSLPTDLWYPVTKNILPGISNQVSAGYYYNIPSAEITLSGEVYYKALNNIVEYKEGAQLILSNDYEKEMVRGKGSSYGIEFFAARTVGKFTGWAGYTLSYTQRYFDSLNNGKAYYARQDRRHDISLVGQYDISKHWGASTNIVYSTGTPFTGQTGQYLIPTPGFRSFEALPTYTARNAMRLSSSFRIDLDVQYKFALGKHVKGDIHLSVYNVLNRAQPNSVERVWDEQKNAYKYRQQGLFGTITAAAINFNL